MLTKRSVPTVTRADYLYAAEVERNKAAKAGDRGDRKAERKHAAAYRRLMAAAAKLR